MMNSLPILTVVYLFICITLAIIPYLTRKTENFGVTIPVSYYNRRDFQAMRRHYMFLLLGIGLLSYIGIMIFNFFVSTRVIDILFIIHITVYLLLSFVLYLPFHLKMKKIKDKEDWQATHEQKTVIDLTFRKEKLTHSNWLFLIPTLLLITSITLLIIFYQRMPEKIPINYGFDGTIHYIKTTTKSLLFLPSMQLFLLLLFLGMNIMIKHAKQLINAENPEKSRQQNIIYRKRWSAFTIISATVLQAIFLYQQIGFIYDGLMLHMNWIMLITTFFLIMGVLILAITTGQGGSRVSIQENTNLDRFIDRDDDIHWKLGQFYVNRQDPAIFIEKRFGVGWTNNWAHPISWLLLLGIFTITIGIVLIFN